MKNIIIFLTILLSGCVSTENKRDTLRSLDVISNTERQSKVFTKPKTDTDTRAAYIEYLKYATKNDQSRLDAINRLAELEFELSSKLQKETSNQDENSNSDNERLYNERLDKTIELLTTSINDYPDAAGNDKILYQLAKAYDHKGAHSDSEKTLLKLIKKYPKSDYLLESQFRIAEILFSKREFSAAENVYTEILSTSKNNIFYEKSLFKRGWSRFKQEYYLEAVDDYLEAVSFHNFDEYSELSQNQLEQFNEYFRAIGLSFSYLGGAEPLNEYFRDNPNFKYIYHTYAHVSDIYLKQLRYSDAVDTLNYFVKNNPNSNNVPTSLLKIAEIWNQGGFAKKAAEIIDIYYVKYNPESNYWLSNHNNSESYKKSDTGLKINMLLVSSYFHKLYLENKKNDYFIEAEKWYQRYIKHYKSTAKKDDIYYQYANLLAHKNMHINSLENYELAAYDDEIILNKNAAYATITLTNKLFAIQSNKVARDHYLNKHIKYATLYSQLYPNDKQAAKIVLHAAELAFQSEQYQKAVELSESITNVTGSSDYIKAQTLKAHAYFNSKQYENSEAAYYAVLSSNIHMKQKQALSDKLALSIYKQAEKSNDNGEISKAIEHFMRIHKLAPDSSISATGMYDAIALSMKNEYWDIAIRNIKQFQGIYPHHKLNNDVTKKLSVAYLKSNQGIKAAKEFERISSFENDTEFKTAALWQAAELYESKGETEEAIRSFEKYAHTYKEPYAQNVEAMKNLTKLYASINRADKITFWNNEIIKADKRALNKYKTERTRYITSFASLELAKNVHNIFMSQKLVLPLNISLRKKKDTMLQAVKLYGRASKYGIAETATESTFEIAEIYETFSKDLLASERPTNLKGEELAQYVLLLEDKAYPFEDKAIEFYEANMSHVKDGIYNKWVKQSHDKLRKLFPARYNRAPKLDRTINVLH